MTIEPVVPGTTGWIWIVEHPGIDMPIGTDWNVFGGVTSSFGYVGQLVAPPTGTSVPSMNADADWALVKVTTGGLVPGGTARQ